MDFPENKGPKNSITGSFFIRQAISSPYSSIPIRSLTTFRKSANASGHSCLLKRSLIFIAFYIQCKFIRASWQITYRASF